MRILLLSTIFFTHIQGAWAQAERARITGYVRDADGNPIELAIVQVKNTIVGSMTNEKGFYSVSLASGDSIVLLFSCLGYNKAERILPKLAGDLHLNVQMNALSFDLGGVSVTASRRQTDMLESIQAGQVKLLPDPSGGSIESLVVTFAGVSTSNEMSSQYSVRGGSYDENIVYVNGLEVFRPLLIRSGEQEGLSFVNPDLTEEVKFAAGGFEARYGDKMSSVLDIAYKKPEKLEGSASLGLLGANAYVGSSAGTFTQVTGLRFKTARLLLGTLDTDAQYDPVFVDLQTYMTWLPAPKWELNFLGNVSSNTYRFIPRERSTSFGTTTNVKNLEVSFGGQEHDRFQTQFGALTLKYTPNANSEFGLQASAFNSMENETYDIAAAYWINEDEGSEAVASQSPFEAGYFHEHARNRLHAVVMNVGHYGMLRSGANTVRWGANLQQERIADRISEWEMRDSAGYTLPHRPDGPFVYSNLYSDNEISGTRLSAYVQDVFKFRSRQGLFTIIGGLRGSYWTYNGEFILSPRGSIGFIPNFEQDLTLRVAAGLYYQPPFYKELRQMTVDDAGNRSIELNRNLKSQRSIHFILGGDYTFRMIDRNFKISAEAYYKRLDRLNPYTVDNVKLYYYGENCASGYAAGIDLKFFGEMVAGTDSWLSISLMKAEQEIRGIRHLPLPNNPGYNLSLYFSDYFPGYKRLTLNLRGMLSGRLPVTPPYKGYEGGYYRTTPYRRVDVGLAYQLAGGQDAIMDRGLFRKLKSIRLGIDLFNLLGIDNASSYLWITDVHSRQLAVPNYLTGRQLSARVLVEF
ncbi:MAG: TonB-dependent receptor [Tannerellaceae bacterium]|jgi:hypothetical protein|nr:TonB-dependent receptor [Tannerellaceae bacterium]